MEGGGGKPEVRLRPSFLAALPIYILRRIYPRMCMFLISWMHAAFTCARMLIRRCISLAEHLAEHEKLAFPLIYPSGLPVTLLRSFFTVLSHPSSHFCTNPRSFIPFPLLIGPLLASGSFFSRSCYLSCFLLLLISRTSNIFVSFPRAFSSPCLLALRDPLKSFSLCFSRYSFSRATPPT